jgi:hypothetical protein
VARARTLQDQKLMAEGKDLSSQNEARSETISETEKLSHHWSHKGYTSLHCKCNDFYIYRVFGKDRIRTPGLLIANSGENKLRQGATIT